MNKTLLLAAVVLGFSASIMTPTASVFAQNGTQPTVPPAHYFHPGHLAWRAHAMYPHGIYHGHNIVVLPANSLANNVVNNCPYYAPVLLSTGVCVTQQQALQQQAQGQLQLGGQVQAYGNVIVGRPAVLAAHGFNSPYALFSHFHSGMSGMHMRR